MGNITTGMVIVMCINLMLFLGQFAITDVNPTGTIFYTSKGDVLSGFDTGNHTLTSDPTGYIPSGESSVNPETGNIFTDTFTASRSWILDKTGISYVINFLGAPAIFLASIGLPPAFSWGVGALWMGLTLFLLVAFILGRDV